MELGDKEVLKVRLDKFSTGELLRRLGDVELTDATKDIIEEIIAERGEGLAVGQKKDVSTRSKTVSESKSAWNSPGLIVVRFIVLAFLFAYSLSMGKIPSHELNAFGVFVASLFFLIAPLFYFFPTIEAMFRRHPNAGAIAALNLFLGWSLIGWVIALVWAVKKPEPGVALKSIAPVAEEPRKETKTCPFCAEDILIKAIKCKHCGSDLTSKV